MIIFTLVLSLSCPATTIINHTAEWTEYDQKTLKGAETRCGELFEDAPCLKTFIKKEDRLYNAICGVKNES